MATKPWDRTASALMQAKPRGTQVGLQEPPSRRLVSLQTKQLLEINPKFPAPEGEEESNDVDPQFILLQFLRQIH